MQARRTAPRQDHHKEQRVVDLPAPGSAPGQLRGLRRRAAGQLPGAACAGERAMARSDNGIVITVARAALREPFTRRARLELLWCVVGVVFGSAGAVVILAPLTPGTAAS